MSTTYDIGDEVDLSFTIAANATVTLTVTLPDGTTSSPTVANPGAGSYAATYTTTQAGPHVYLWSATGAVVAAEDGWFLVERDADATAYATVAELKARFPIDNTDSDAQLERALIAASRAIDQFCGRRFYADTTATARVYRACDSYLLWVDDISTTTGLVVKTDAAANGTYDTTLTVGTDYIVEPPNALAQGKPVSKIRLVSRCWPADAYGRYRVELTARWGWPRIPDDVREACLLEAAHLFMRKDSVNGVAGVSDFGVVRVSRFMDPDAQRLLAPFVEVGVA